MFLPAVYVPLFLSSRRYTIKQMWERLYPAIQQRQEVEVCAPLIRWLQVASTVRALADAAAMGDPVLASPLYSPAADEALLS
jgi:hypothetical protein